ncbi:MAG: lytic transglycosylase domain-containing protein [Sphingomonadaceae bacterium]|nr:lytic transglycosylase domain-containing protein [Sphingomonadaceae bacterium]
MMTGTSRERQLAAVWLAMGIAGSVLASPAQADVLEVSVGGSNWVAGGPPRAALPVQPPEAVSYEPVPGSRPVAVTHTRTTAGPPQWQAHVAYLSQKYDVSPALIEALVWQESRWRPNARSPVGASGLAQLMPGTARELGVNPWDPFANLEGGVRYLRQQLDRFDGDVEKALAAYNAGPGRVLRAGGVPNIRETRGYVASIMARLASPVRR